MKVVSAAIVLAGAAATLIVLWDQLYGHTLDVGFHYALSEAELGRLHGGSRDMSYLGIMADYPPGAHWTAALIGAACGSVVRAMCLLSAVAVYAGYLSVALLLVDQNAWRSGLRLSAMMLLTACLAWQRAALGYQTILNFFFPQLVADALVLLAIAAAMRAPPRELPRWLYLAGAAAFVWVLASIQPLASLQFTGTSVVFLALTALLRSRMNLLPRVSWVEAVVSCIVLLGCVSLHPAFRTMASIASNEGYLRFGELISAGGYSLLMGAALAVVVACLFNGAAGRLDQRMSVLLASAVLAGFGLLTAQMLAYAGFALGSTYAIGKHVFFLALATSVALSYSLGAVMPESRDSFARLAPSPAIVASLFSVIAVSIVYTSARPWKQDVTELLSLQQFVGANTGAERSAVLQGNTVALDRRLAGSLNFAVTFGDLHLPFAVAIASSRPFREAVSTPVKYGIVDAQPKHRDAEASCTGSLSKLASARYAVVERECYAEQLRRIRPEETLATRAGERGAELLVTGWAEPESWATWSIGEASSLRLWIAPDETAQTYRLDLAIAPFLAPNRPQQSFLTSVDGSTPMRTTAVQSSEIVTLKLHGAGWHVVDVRVEAPMSPRQLGVSDDDRRIGIALSSIRLVVDDGQTLGGVVPQ